MGNLMGLIAHNFLRHVDAKHNGLVTKGCRICDAHAVHFSPEWEHDAQWVVDAQRRLEGK